VLSFANLIYSRHVLLLAAAVAALSGAGMAGVLDRMAAGWPRRTVAATLLALVLVPPSLLSVPLAVAFARPGPADLAGEWIERNARERPLVGTAYEQFDLAADGFEVVTFEDWWEVPRSALSQFDLLVVRPRDRAAVPALRVLAEFGASTTGHTIVGSGPRAPLSRLRPDEVRGPEGGSPPAAFDADPSTSWDAPAGPVTISVLWRRPAEVVRVELEVDGRDDSWPQRIAWEGLAEGARAWSPLRVFPLRPHNRARQRADAPHGQVFVLTPPVELRGLRLIRAQGPEWGIAELSVLSGPLS
jgi:hypothetical protein